jgi:hypothetical protein
MNIKKYTLVQRSIVFGIMTLAFVGVVWVQPAFSGRSGSSQLATSEMVWGLSHEMQTIALPQGMTVCHKTECIWPTELSLIKRAANSGEYEGKDFQGNAATANLEANNDGTVVFVISVASKGYAGTYTGKFQGNEIVGTYDPRTGAAGFGLPAPFKAKIKGWSTIIEPEPLQPLNDEQIRPIAKLTEIMGDVSVRTGNDEWKDAQVGMILGPDDELHTGPDSAATLVGYKDSWTLDVMEMSHVYIITIEQKESRLKIRVLLQMGQVKAHVVRQRTVLTDFSVQTPTATTSVRGTIFSVRYEQGSRTSTTTVEQGSVSVEPRDSRLAQVTLAANQQVQVSEHEMSAVTAPTIVSLARTTGAPVSGDVPWPTEKDGSTLLGTNLSYFPVNSVAECRAKCANNQQCRGFAFVKRGAFESNPNNGVCYLLSSVTNQVSSACCVSGFRR